MSSSSAEDKGSDTWLPLIQRYWPLLLGLAALVIPSLLDLGSQVWSREWGAHGPIVLLTGLWLIWRQRQDLVINAAPGNPVLTAIGIAASLAAYVWGRAYDFISVEGAGLYGVCMSILYYQFGVRAILRNWFPFFYLAFLIPIPIWLIDQITIPLKTFVSTAATTLLSSAGIPIFQQGVTLIVAQYQLLVEDACSGMNSLIGLSAISLFYIYLLHNASWRYSLFLAVLVIPVAILANIVRIIILVLLTYFFGNAVAQGFLHELAGMVLFATALLFIFLIDSLCTRFVLRRPV